MRQNTQSNGERSPRRGTATLIVVLCLTSLMVVFAFVVNLALMANIQVQVRISADAAADAAASTLVSDDLLRGNPALLPALLAKAQQQAQIFADANPPAGLTGALQLNPTNQSKVDLLFGTIDHAGDTTFRLVGNLTDLTSGALLSVNAVQANPRLTRQRGNAPHLFLGPLLGQDRVEIAATATVMLDRDVIGFAPVNSQPLPLAPIALLQDFSGVDVRSWAYQVDDKKGEDAYTYDPTARQFLPGPDQLVEFKAVMALDASQLADANVAILFIGQTTVAGLTQQLGIGVTTTDLANCGAPFVLDRTNRLTVKAQMVGPAGASTDLTNLAALLSRFAATGEARIWPLYTGEVGSTASVCGFVAARLVYVETPSAGQPLHFRLQQTMLATPAAVTDFTRRGINSSSIVNPYLCKVRFVQ
jgi:hypothetical protein